MSSPAPTFIARVIKVLSSFGLATTVLSLLLLVTYLGTLEQSEHGLYDSQKKYFESMFITNIDMGCCFRAMHVSETMDSFMPKLLNMVAAVFPRLAALLNSLFESLSVRILLLLLVIVAGMILLFGIYRSIVDISRRAATRQPIAGSIGLLLALVYAVFVLASGWTAAWSRRETLGLLLPGGVLLMFILAINMTLGGLIRLKKEAVWLAKLPLRLVTGRFSELSPAPRAVGVFIAHFSIVFMLLAGLLSLMFKWDGAVSLREGESSDEFHSFHDSVIEIERLSPAPKDGKRTALVIDGGYFIDLSEGKGRTFTKADLPFELMVMNYAEHCEPRRATGDVGSKQVVDGYFLQPTAKLDERGKPLGQEAWADGAYVKAKLKDGSEQGGILWRFAAAPFSVKVGDEVWGVTLSRRAWRLPFVVKLDKFEREVHPGTEQARRFTSHVTVVEEGREHKRIITMNEPLRSRGFAFFQQSFDMQQDASGGIITRSQFQVVKNPSDHWPLIACVTAGLGLLIHVVWQLLRYLKRGNATPPRAA